MAVFQSLENAHFGADCYAVFRDDFTDLHENLQKRSSLVREWRRRFEFVAFHLHSKKFQPDRCRTWLFFSHWKTLILEPISMPCSVTTSPISMKTCTKGHRWCKNGDAGFSSSLIICIQKKSSLTGAEHGCFSVTGKRSFWHMSHTGA